MSDYMNVTTKNLQKFLNNCLKRQKQELIEKFLEKIRHIPLFWAIFSDELREVYENIDEIRDNYQKILREVRSNR